MAFLAGIVEGLTVESVITFIGSKALGTGVGWLTNKALDGIFGGKTATEKNIQYKLNSIHQDFEKIKEVLKEITVEIEWEHLNTRIFQAEIDICHKFQLLLLILSIEDETERSIEIERLNNGILETNGGVLCNLFVIHQVLVGYTITNPTKGLLELWSEGVYKSMIQNPMSAKSYQDNVMNFLTKASILQLKGIILLSAANKSAFFVGEQASLIKTHLESQLHVIEKSLPNMKDLTDPDKNNEFVLILYRGADIKPIMFVCRQHYKIASTFWDKNTSDEIWIFEKSPTFDKDGSLLISASSNRTSDTKYYMSVSEKNTAICVSRKCEAQSFFVIPLLNDGRQQVIICKSESGPQRFLDHNLNFVDRQGEITFIKCTPGREEHLPCLIM